jgi:hypothetical protein
MTKGRVALSAKIDEWLKETAGLPGVLEVSAKALE